ncbi:MAG TPA: AsmA-like C-terminal domain-containing protein [Nitrospirota bacterium]|nr:AsmA-like C-terminal domain-containing protein [Nitrospirota bacterium]
MSLRKKIVLFSVVIFCVLLALLSAAILVAPSYLNSTSIKAKIETAISQEFGGTIQYQRLNISIFPRPYIVFLGTHFSIPKTVKGVVKSISIYPQLSPLVKGKLFISRIRIQEPDLTITLPETVSEVRPEELSLPEVKKNIRLVLGDFQAIGPRLFIDMDKGTLVLRRKGHVVLVLRDAAAQFNAPPGVMDIMLKANTESWGAFSLKGRYSFDEEKTDVEDLFVSMGSSSISGLSASLAWTDAPSLDITSGNATFTLDEMYRWLSSSGTLTAYLEGMKSVSGSLDILSIRAHVPLYQLSASHITVAGEARHVVVDTSLLPAQLFVTSRFLLTEKRISLADLSAQIGKSSLSHVSAFLNWGKKPFIRALSGSAVMNLTEIFQWRRRYGALQDRLKVVKTLTGVLNLSSINFEGPLFEPALWSRAITGSIEQIRIDSRLLPGPFTASYGNFSLVADKIMLFNVQASMLDSNITCSGAVSGDGSGIHEIDFDFAGTSGSESVAWAFTKFALPRELMLNAPVTFTNSHLVWQEKEGTTFVGKFTVANGPALSIDFSQKGTELHLRRGTIDDRDTNAVVAVRQNKTTTDLSFSGKLAQPTLDRIFEQRFIGRGSIQGDMHTTIHRDRLMDSVLQGTMRGDDIVIARGLDVPLTIDKFSVHAGNKIITIDSAALTQGNSHYAIDGRVTYSDAAIVFDMNLGADTIAVSAIQQVLSGLSNESTEKIPAPTRLPPLLGTVRVNSSFLLFGRYNFTPVKAVVTLSPHKASMVFTEARTCGISIPGTLIFSGSEIIFDFKPIAAKQPLEPTLTCLPGITARETGTFDLRADIRSHGQSGTLVKSLEGQVDFTSNEGKLYHYPVLAKIFSVLSVLEIFRGKLPEVGGNGFPYHTMVIKGKLREGKFELEEAYIHGTSVDIIAQGQVDLAAQKMDLVVLVAPFSTINWIISHIPLVGSIMGGTLVSVPVKVSGDPSNPDVTYLAPSAVGTRLLNLLENILELPVKIVSPILPKEQEKKE